MSTGPAQSPMPLHLRRLLESQADLAESRLSLCTRTKVDTGRWLGRSRLWLCVTDEHLILLAASKRTYFEQVPFADCMDSYYSHTTGQFVIAPAEGVRFPHLKLTPTQALAVLDLIERPGPARDTVGPDNDTNPDTNATENSRA